MLFAGVTQGGAVKDTWEWDGTLWVERMPAASPPARRHHALAYDSLRRRVLLFGGNIGPRHRYPQANCLSGT